MTILKTNYKIAITSDDILLDFWVRREVQDEVHLADLNDLEKMVANSGVDTAKNELSKIRQKVEQVGKRVMNLLIRLAFQ